MEVIEGAALEYKQTAALVGVYFSLNPFSMLIIRHGLGLALFVMSNLSLSPFLIPTPHPW